MNLITTTELRTKMPEVISMLLAGKSIDLIHRSKILGEITPKKYLHKPLNAKRLQEIVEKMNLPVLSQKEIDRRYRKYMTDRYGKYLSRHK